MRNLKTKSQWVCWRYSDRNGQRTKVPLDPQTGRFARTNDRSTWATFDEAERAAKKWGCDGVGFVFANDLFGIDIDGGDGHTTQNPLQNEILSLFMGAYTEKSPSGSGLHILFRCDRSRLPLDENGKLQNCYYLKNPRSNLEFYGGGLTSRFFTYTGDRVSDSDEIIDKTDAVLLFLERYMRREDVGLERERRKLTAERDTIPRGFAAPAVYYPPANGEENDEIAEALKIARRSKNGEKFKSLFDRGDTSAYGGDDSAADLALTALLSFYLQGNEELIDSAFRQSALCRPKWTQREDYRAETIRKAVALCAGTFYRSPGRPRSSEAKSGGGGELFTIAALQSYLDERGASVRLNLLTQRTELSGFEGENAERLAENAPAIIFNELQSKYKRVSPAIISDFLNVISARNCYNPVLQTLDSVTYDGVDRLSELYKILDIADDLSQTLVHKWLLQSIALLHNGGGGSAYGADGCLVLQGAQGIGKTSVFRKLAIKEEFFREGVCLDFKSKDCQILALSGWISELGELESSLRGDVEKLKAFVTQTLDEIRRPYGKEAVRALRRTSLCATTNSAEFLVDSSGNRRFWVVPVEKIDLDRLARLDVLQLWAQISVEAAANPQGFRLTQEEQRLLAERNSQHERPLRGQEEVEDIINTIERPGVSVDWRFMTVSDFRNYYIDELRSYSVSQIGKCLDRLNIRAEVRRVGNSTQRLRRLPHRRYY